MATALTGTSVPIVRINDKGELVVSVAVPIQRMRAVLGVLLLSTQGGDIDNIVARRALGHRARLRCSRRPSPSSSRSSSPAPSPARCAASPTAAERVRHSVKARAEIPDFTDRTDEIGHLSGALRDMTNALYNRIDAIESFAADVAHELKNPLTSLRSAAETLPLAKTEDSQERLMEIIQHDVRRLDRLISDISDASRLDAELAREDAEPVDIAELLRTTVVAVQRHPPRRHARSRARDRLRCRAPSPIASSAMTAGLSQVIINLLDNALSFSPPGGSGRGRGAAGSGAEIEIAVEDEGPGIPPRQSRAHLRALLHRPPAGELSARTPGSACTSRGRSSMAHGGRLYAENRPPSGMWRGKGDGKSGWGALRRSACRQPDKRHARHV